jgi:hypothetical protein
MVLVEDQNGEMAWVSMDNQDMNKYLSTRASCGNDAARCRSSALHHGDQRATPVR